MVLLSLGMFVVTWHVYAVHATAQMRVQMAWYEHGASREKPVVLEHKGQPQEAGRCQASGWHLQVDMRRREEGGRAGQAVNEILARIAAWIQQRQLAAWQTHTLSQLEAYHDATVGWRR